MGVTMKCKKTGNDLDLGYAGFNRFRNKVAELHDKEFGEHYRSLTDAFLVPVDERKALFEEFDKKTKTLLAEKKLNIKILDFCFQSDCGGKIRYGACKVIYDTIKDYDDNICYGYAGRPDCTMFRDLKALMLECYENKCNLIWY